MKEDTEEKDNKFKRMVVLGGDKGTGKTSMSIRHMKGKLLKQYRVSQKEVLLFELILFF